MAGRGRSCPFTHAWTWVPRPQPLASHQGEYKLSPPDEDIAMLDTPTPWSSPSCNSFPTQLPRRPRIQQTRRHCFGHNFLIRHRNGPFLDAKAWDMSWRIAPVLDHSWRKDYSKAMRKWLVIVKLRVSLRIIMKKVKVTKMQEKKPLFHFFGKTVYPSRNHK